MPYPAHHDAVAETSIPRRPANGLFERLSSSVTMWVGSSTALVCAALLITSWLVIGPLCHFSDTWQLVMNTVSSVVTFVMVFLIQRSQNKDALALHLKLNELVKAQHGASNRLIDVERLSEDELRALHARYERLAEILSRTHPPHPPGSPGDAPVGTGGVHTGVLPEPQDPQRSVPTSPSAPVQPSAPDQGMSRPTSTAPRAPRAG